MIQNIVNIGVYKYLVEHYDANTDLKDNQYSAEFLMLRNFSVLNNIIYDNDIYIIEREYFDTYKNELISNNESFGNTLAFPITNLKINSYSNSYKKFNSIFNIFTDNINGALIDEGGDFTNNVYDLYTINETKNIIGEVISKQLKKAKIKCDKIKIYHPLTLKKLDMIIDICNYINGINFHYLCKPINTYVSKTDKEIKYDNETYSEYIEVYFPNISEIFKVDEEGKYKIYYKEDFNIIASTQNEKFINSIMSDSADIEHSELFNGEQIVPLNLIIQPYRIVEEYNSSNLANYNDTIADDEKQFVKLYLKNNVANNINNSSTISMILYPYKDVDEHNNMYILHPNLTPGYLHTNTETKFKIMSRTGFSDGIISVVSLFDYPNKSYFNALANKINKDVFEEAKTTPIKEAYKYYNNVDDKYYNLFMNDEIVQELQDIDEVNSLSPDILKTVKDICGGNYVDKDEAIMMWKTDKKNEIIKNNKYSANESISKQLSEINNTNIDDAFLYNEILPYLKENRGVNYADDDELLTMWKQIMKETIVKEYEEEYKTPANFLGYKIQIATDISFKHIIYDRNMRVNFNDLDDFAFKLNGIFTNWNEKPEQLLCKIMFYDRLLGIELTSNLVIITKEWFKYLVNDNNYVHRLTDLSFINKKTDDINMKVINLNLHDDITKLNELKNILSDDLLNNKEDLNINYYDYLEKYVNKIDTIINDLTNEVNTNKINFINSIKCIVNKKGNNEININKANYNQKVIFKPIFYKVKDLQNLVLRPNINQKIGINLSDYMSKIGTFKIVIENTEYVEIGRNNIFVIFDINSNNLDNQSGIYNLIDNNGNYISSGNWIIK